MKTEALLPKMKEKLYKRYKGKCAICQEPLAGLEKIEIHHIRPVKEGGKNNIRNLQPLHRICHQKITHERAK